MYDSDSPTKTLKVERRDGDNLILSPAYGNDASQGNGAFAVPITEVRNFLGPGDNIVGAAKTTNEGAGWHAPPAD